MRMNLKKTYKTDELPEPLTKVMEIMLAGFVLLGR